MADYLAFVDQVVSIGLYLVLFFGIGGGFLYFSFMKQFKHKLVLREDLEGNSLVSIKKIREYKDKDGIVWWSFFEKRFKIRKIKVPPSNAIEISTDGTKIAEAFKSPDGNLSYISIKNVNKGSFANSLDNDDRTLTLYELQKSKEHRKKSVSELIMQLAPLVAMVVIVVCLMIFYGEIAQPVLKAQELQNNYASIQKEQLQILKEIKLNIQTIPEQSSSSTSTS